MLAFCLEFLKFIFEIAMDVGSSLFIALSVIILLECCSRLEKDCNGFNPRKRFSVFEIIIGLIVLAIISNIPLLNWFLVYYAMDNLEMVQLEVCEKLKKRFDAEIRLWEIEYKDET